MLRDCSKAQSRCGQVRLVLMLCSVMRWSSLIDPSVCKNGCDACFLRCVVPAMLVIGCTHVCVSAPHGCLMSCLQRTCLTCATDRPNQGQWTVMACMRLQACLKVPYRWLYSTSTLVSMQVCGICLLCLIFAPDERCSSVNP